MKKKSTLKSALALIRKDATTFIERSDHAKKESVVLLMAQGIAEFDGGVAEITDGAKSFIRGCNKIREAGRRFEEAEQIGQFEFRHWHTDVESWKQDAIRRAKIKAAQKVFRTMPEKAEKMDDCAPVMHALFELSGVMEKTHRLGGETAHEPPNPFNAFISTAASAESWLRKWEPEDVPLADYYRSCKVETLESVKMAIRPIVERDAIIEQVLKEKIAAT